MSQRLDIHPNAALLPIQLLSAGVEICLDCVSVWSSTFLVPFNDANIHKKIDKQKPFTDFNTFLTLYLLSDIIILVVVVQNVVCDCVVAQIVLTIEFANLVLRVPQKKAVVLHTLLFTLNKATVLLD